MSSALKADHFLVDKNGRPEAVVLSLADYQRLLQLADDAEDAKTLRHAIRTRPHLISHAQLVERLKRQGLL